MTKPYACPKCNCTELNVVVSMTGALDQFDDGYGVFLLGHHSPLDAETPTTCRECGHSDAMKRFKVAAEKLQ